LLLSFKKYDLIKKELQKNIRQHKSADVSFELKPKVKQNVSDLNI